MNQKKYILKPGKHQFVPGEHARHDNDNLTDAEAEWYLKRYPHIRSLFSNYPKANQPDIAAIGTQDQRVICSGKKTIRNRKSEIRNQRDENLPATN